MGLCALFAAQQTRSQSKNEEKNEKDLPNVLFIIADDMGYGDPACYGNPYTRTPNIDKLAAEGIRFTRGYAGSSVSSPSRCALLTGLHTGHSRIRSNFVDAAGIEGMKGTQTIRRQGLTPEDVTIADVMKENGYVTGLVNKWHQDGFDPNAGPLDHGFDEFRGWLISTSYSNDPYYYPEWRFHGRELVKIPENENGRQVLHNNDISTDDAIDFIQRHKDERFFLYLAYDTPHEPYVINDTGLYDGYDWDETSRLYAALITHMDQNIGRVLACLDELGIADNTLILFISDNGGASMAPHRTLRPNGILRGLKGNLYEGGLRVPMIVKMPGGPEGAVCHEPVWFPDILPTVAGLTNSPAPEGIDGIDLAPLWTGQRMNLKERVLYWEFPGKSYALIRGPWKIVRPNKNSPTELYNLDNDISETTDLAEVFPEIVRELERIALSESTPSENFPNGWKGFNRTGSREQ